MAFRGYCIFWLFFLRRFLFVCIRFISFLFVCLSVFYPRSDATFLFEFSPLLFSSPSSIEFARGNFTRFSYFFFLHSFSHYLKSHWTSSSVCLLLPLAWYHIVVFDGWVYECYSCHYFKAIDIYLHVSFEYVHIHTVSLTNRKIEVHRVSRASMRERHSRSTKIVIFLKAYTNNIRSTFSSTKYVFSRLV